MMRRALYALAQMPWFIGVGRAIDIGGALNRPNPYAGYHSAAAADAAAIRSDWNAVGAELRRAMRAADRELAASHTDGTSE